MATTFRELRRKVLMGIKNIGGEDILMAEQAINDACHALAEVHEFEELITLDKTHAVTVDGTQRYHLVDDLGLTRPKSIYSIVVHDDYESSKLTFVPFQRWDLDLPYPEGISEDRPAYYTRQDAYVEFAPIPNAAYPLYIRYSQWPLVMTAETDECSLVQEDRIIVAFAREIFLALRAGLALDVISKAKAYFDTTVKDDRSNPDSLPVARGFTSTEAIPKNEYWNDPFFKG